MCTTFSPCRISSCLHRASIPKLKHTREMMILHTFPVLGKTFSCSYQKGNIEKDYKHQVKKLGSFVKEYLLRMEILFMRMFVFRIVRYSIGYLRYYIFRYIFKNIKKFSGDQGHLGLDTLEYNFKNIKRSITTHSRIYHMLYPLLALSYIDMNKQNLKVLTIGPRSEGEIFLIAAHGFRFSNITGIDLFSYSPKIEVGDMHSMHFKDNNFDIIFQAGSWLIATTKKKHLKKW